MSFRKNGSNQKLMVITTACTIMANMTESMFGVGIYGVMDEKGQV